MSMPPLRIAIPAAASLSVLAVVFAMAVFPLTKILEVGKGLAFHDKMLDAHLTTVRHNDRQDTVQFLSDGTLGRVMGPEGRYWEPRFEVGKSDVFYSLRRDNAYTEFRVHHIEDDGVVIEYDSKVHNLNGDNQLVSVDHGLVRLGWKENDSRYIWPYPEP